MDIDPYQEQVIKFLNKNYFLKNNTFFGKVEEKQCWGKAIVVSVSQILYFDFEFCEDIFKRWAHSIGLPDDEEVWRKSYNPTRLNATWSPELAQDLAAFTLINAEAELVAYLAEEIKREINSEILNTLVTSATTGDDFIEIMKCEGYQLGPTMYNPTNFTPFKSFISMTHDELLNERENSIHWQNWLRARKHN